MLQMAFQLSPSLTANLSKSKLPATKEAKDTLKPLIKQNFHNVIIAPLENKVNLIITFTDWGNIGELASRKSWKKPYHMDSFGC